MYKNTNIVKHLLAGLALAAAPVAFADSIDPLTYSNTLGVGESVTITKTVTITSAPPTTALMDVMFLMDTTGSMGSVIAAAKSAASTILNDLSAFGDLASGAAYFGDDTGSPAPLSTYTGIYAALSTNDANTQAGINAYTVNVPTYGGDGPEEGYLGITRTVDDTAWRPGSNRFVVMFGDANDGGNTPFAGDSFAEASAALAADNVTLIGVSYSSTFTSTYSTIANNSGGGIYAGSTTASTLANIIKSAVTNTFSTYSSVCLDAGAAPAGVGVTLSPTCINGSFDRSIDRTFNFNVTFTGNTVGDYVFPIYAKVNGGIVATETDHITVVSAPEPATLALFGAGLGLLSLRRRKQTV